jgi:hypothetical protein
MGKVCPWRFDFGLPACAQDDCSRTAWEYRCIRRCQHGVEIFSRCWSIRMAWLLFQHGIYQDYLS